MDCLVATNWQHLGMMIPTAKSNPAEIARFLTGHYPRVHRLAFGLCGDAALAGDITRTIFMRSLPALPRWRSESEADNWFLHHTLLECRHKKAAGGSAQPALAAADPPQVPAFAQALVRLPFQQKEAFLLTHGEKLDLRRAAVAMDCSITATGNHLTAATNRLRAVAGADFDARTSQWVAAYLAAPPPGDLIIQQSFSAAARRRIGRAIAGILLAIGASILAFFAHQLWAMLDY
jgi:DNA-directed RNA polymerase specialized sigma24 family protein